jgi:WD40 repeat protein
VPGVFISYAREDQVFVRRLYEALRADGRDPLWDQDHEAVPFSTPWWSEVRASIEKSDKFIFVVSPDSLDSGPCTNEFTYATEVHKQVIPVIRVTPGEEQGRRSPVWQLTGVLFADDASFDGRFAELTTALDTDLPWTRAHTRLLVRSSEWAAAKQDRSLLLRGSDLRGAESWLAQAGAHPGAQPTAPEREYVLASRRGSDRTARIWRGALATGLAVALGLATFAFISRDQAVHAATVANARKLAAQATADLAVNPAKSLREALASTTANASAPGIRALRLALADDRARLAFQPGFGPATQAAWSPAAEMIAVTGRGNSVQLWDPRTGALTRTLGSLPPADPITQLSYNPAGTLLAAIASNGRVAMWDPRTGAAVDLTALNAGLAGRRLSNSLLPVLTTGVSLAATWDPQTGQLFVYGPDLRGILAYRPAARRVVALSTPAPVNDLAFAPSGSRAWLYTYDSASFTGTAQIVSFRTGASITVPPPTSQGPGWGVNEQACWTPDGSEIATWDPLESQDDSLRVFSPRTGAQLYERVGNGPFSAAACGVAAGLGPYVAAGDRLGDGFVLQASDLPAGPAGTVRREYGVIGLTGHTQAVNSVATSRAGAYVATGSSDGTVRVWVAATGRQVSLLPSDGQPVTFVAFSPDGGAVVAVTATGLVRVLDAGVGEPAVPLRALAAGRTYALGFADGGRLAYGVDEQTRTEHHQLTVTGETALLWDAGTGRLAASYRLPAPPRLASPQCPPPDPSADCEQYAPARAFSGLSVSPDGRYLAYVSGSAIVARGFAGGASRRLPLPAAATGLTFAGPDDVLVMTNQSVLLWRPFTGGSVTRIPQAATPFDAELAAGGSRLVTANANDSATVWQAATGRVVTTIRPHRPHLADTPAGEPVPVRAAINAAGTRFAVGTAWGSVDIWRVGGRQPLASHLVTTPETAPDEFAVGELDFSADGSAVLAVNYAQPNAGFAEPPGTALVLDARTGGVMEVLSTGATGGAAGPEVNPAAALSPAGGYVLGGEEGFAPLSMAAGDEAIYDLRDSDQLADLRNAVAQAPPVVNQVSNLVPVDAWAPDGIRVLTGAPAIYPCDACGSLAQLQAAARLRAGWSKVLTPARDHPPGDNAFF